MSTHFIIRIDKASERLRGRADGSGRQQDRFASAQRRLAGCAESRGRVRHSVCADVGQDAPGRRGRLLHAGARDPQVQGKAAQEQEGQEEAQQEEVQHPVNINTILLLFLFVELLGLILVLSIHFCLVFNLIFNRNVEAYFFWIIQLGIFFKTDIS